MLGPSRHRLLGKQEQKVGLGRTYFNKLLPSIFRQVSRREQAILASTYYFGHVRSIFGQNLNDACRRRLDQILGAYYIYPYDFFDFSSKIKVKIFEILCHKPVLGSPDNTLTKC